MAPLLRSMAESNIKFGKRRAAASKTFVLVAVFLQSAWCAAKTTVYFPAFAAPSGGGFGGGKTGGFAKKNNKSKGKKQKRGSLLEEVGVPNAPPASKTKDNNMPLVTEAPKLDKWGLPPPTIEDIFPPMPPGT